MNREGWLTLENAKRQAQAARVRREEEMRKTLHQWALSTLADIKALHTEQDRIAALLERGEQFFDLRQDL